MGPMSRQATGSWHHLACCNKYQLESTDRYWGWKRSLDFLQTVFLDSLSEIFISHKYAKSLTNRNTNNPPCTHARRTSKPCTSPPNLPTLTHLDNHQSVPPSYAITLCSFMWPTPTQDLCSTCKKKESQKKKKRQERNTYKQINKDNDSKICSSTWLF